jgi:hypothetical protein
MLFIKFPPWGERKKGGGEKGGIENPLFKSKAAAAAVRANQEQLLRLNLTLKYVTRI